MKNQLPDRFVRAVTSLYQAFFEGTLVKGSCYACAVGNIIATSCNYQVRKDGCSWNWGLEIASPDWQSIFITFFGHDGQSIMLNNNKSPSPRQAKGLDQIKKTDYKWQELAKIEHAFETSTQIEHELYDRSNKEQQIEDQYNGLMAVIPVLCEIEDIDPTEFLTFFEYNIEDNKIQPVKELTFA